MVRGEMPSPHSESLTNAGRSSSGAALPSKESHLVRHRCPLGRKVDHGFEGFGEHAIGHHNAVGGVEPLLS